MDCKSSIPSSNLGVALKKGVWWNGRHNRLKICWLIGREGSSPSTPKLHFLLFQSSCLVLRAGFKNLLINLLGKHDYHYNPLWRHGHIKFFSIKTLTNLLKKCNLKVVKKKFSGRFYPISNSMIFLIKKS